MSTIPACPQCASENTYQDGDLYICPDCAHEWNPSAQESVRRDRWMPVDLI